MFAAMAAPLKGAGGVLSPAKKERRRCRVAPPPFMSSGSLLRRLEVHGRRTAALCGDLVIDLLAFIQAVQARTLDGADMDEHVLAAIGRLDEAETLGGIEPLH